MAFASRRKDVCEEAAKEAGGTAIGLECDVTDEVQCQRVVDEAVEGLGGLDDVVYTAGAISLVALAEADAGWWRRTFDTNVMGAALITGPRCRISNNRGDPSSTCRRWRASARCGPASASTCRRRPRSTA